MCADELAELRIEISVLSEPQPLTYASPEELLGQLQPGVSGVVLQLEGHLGMVEGILDTLVNHQAPEVRTGSARDPEGDHVH